MHTQEIIKFIEQHSILSGIWIFLLIMILYTTINNWLFRSQELSIDKTIFLLNKKNAKILDIRNPQDYSLEHIIYSINVPVEKIKRNDISELKKIKNNPIILVHSNITLSHSIKRHLQKLGFLKTYVLNGGITAWKVNNLPLFTKKTNNL